MLPVFDEAFLWDMSEILVDAKRYDREWKKTLIEIRRLHIKETMKRLVSTMGHENTSEADLLKLEETLKALTTERAALEKES